LFTANITYAEEIVIKDLQVYSVRNEILPPIIVYRDLDIDGTENTANDHIVIEFDITTILKPNLKIIFRFCDKDWKTYDNIFLLNLGKDRFYNLQFKSAPTGVKNYTYTFKQRFPDERGQITFPFSGKWSFIIADYKDDTKIYGYGRFIVVHQEFPMRVRYSRHVIDDNLSDIMQWNRHDKITAEVTTPNSYDAFFQKEVEIVQNQKFNFPLRINVSDFTRNNYYEFITHETKRFIKRDIFPGNEYRQIDLTDTRNYPNDKLLHSFVGIDISRKFQFGGMDFNGGSKRYREDNIYNEYLDFNFVLSSPQIFSKDIFLIGSFNGWTPRLDYRMERIENYYSKILTLKRGIYDYQYVLGLWNDSTKKVEQLDWLELEGSDWGTNNVYYVFAYYQDPLYGGYDRIVAFREVYTR
jgi:hypothetical protein